MMMLTTLFLVMIYSCSNDINSEKMNLSSFQAKGSSWLSVQDIKIKNISENEKEIEMLIKFNKDMDRNSLLNPSNYSFRSCDNDYYHFRSNNYLEYDDRERMLHLIFKLEKKLNGNGNINEKDYLKLANIFDSEHNYIGTDSDQIYISTGEVY